MTVRNEVLRQEPPYGIAAPGFRLPDATRVGAVHLQIDNLQRSLELDRAGLTMDTLSMGMSDDLEAAIVEGATMVRIGRAIFGERAVPPVQR